MFTIVITGLNYGEHVEQIKHMVKTYMIANCCPIIRRCTHYAVCNECIEDEIHILHTPDCNL